jgi:hypothetical protein
VFYVLFLIRPDGVDAFDLARDSVKEAKLDFGYDAVYAGRQIEVRDQEFVYADSVEQTK